MLGLSLRIKKSTPNSLGNSHPPKYHICRISGSSFFYQLQLTHIRLASFYGTSENSAKPDQTLQNAPSDQVVHCLLTDVYFEI